MKPDSPRFLQATNISENGLSIDRENIGFVSESDWVRYPKGRIQTGEVLIEVKGQAEKVAVVPESFPLRTLVSGSLFKMTIDEGKISPWYVFVYFSTRHGKLLRDRLKTNTLIGFVSKPQLYSIPVFLPKKVAEQENIALIAKTAANSLQYGNSLFAKAQKMLEFELGLENSNSQEPKGYLRYFSKINLSEVSNSGRIDAQCFSPNAIFYKNWVQKHAKSEPLIQILQRKTKGHQQKEDPDGSVDYCSIKHISDHEIVTASKCHPKSSAPMAEKNDLLLAITGATIGKVGIVKRYDELAFSGDLLRLRAKSEINPHYLLAVLDHPIGQVQLNRWITGSTNGHLAPRDVGRILVPRLKNAVEARIVELVEESSRKRIESEKLLEDAKARVEQLIEEAAKS